MLFRGSKKKKEEIKAQKNFTEKINRKVVYYGESIIGTSHLSRGIVCQDSSRIEMLENGWCIAAVADGVGSAKHSDIASKIAVETVIELAANEMKQDNNTFEEIEQIFSKAYELAEKRIVDKADELNKYITDFDTTLSCVAYNGETVVFGHCGDGGIIGLKNSGEYFRITQVQKADDGICVIPLRAGKKSWVFGHTDNDVASVLLATDGVYDTFFPYLLKGQPVEIYVPLIRYFMDNNYLNANIDTIEQIKKERIEFITSDDYSSVIDDKTLVVLINSIVKPFFQQESYYDEPDWEYLIEEWNKKAYPHLYAKKEQEESVNTKIVYEEKIEDNTSSEQNDYGYFVEKDKENKKKPFICEEIENECIKIEFYGVDQNINNNEVKYSFIFDKLNKENLLKSLVKTYGNVTLIEGLICEFNKVIDVKKLMKYCSDNEISYSYTVWVIN